MSKAMPFIVGYGGYNAAGRSSGFQSYKRMIFESLSGEQKQDTVTSLANLMGLQDYTEQEVLNRTLIRRIEGDIFDPENVPSSKNVKLPFDSNQPITFDLSKRALNFNLPNTWQSEPLDEEGRKFRISLMSDQDISIKTFSPIAVQAAGQLPTGFNPASHYKSTHHPRGLQLAVIGASDAVRSMGLSWQDVVSRVNPDDIAVYSASVMSQLDQSGLGGMLKARGQGNRVTSKQLALGLNTMPADFINAYVLGNLGSTAGIAGACATYLYNLKQGVEDIKNGRKRVVIVGSSEAPILPEIIDGYSAMGALASDSELADLDGLETPNYRRASRPFGDNCGFTLAESSQYTVLMADDLAFELGAQIFGAVPGVFVNADGYKKSISAPGAGNYITLAKAMGLAQTLLGAEPLKNKSFIHAHGSSTPHNRTTESKIFNQVAEAFGVNNWPVAAVKSYVGHSLGPASGDQMAATLGTFRYGILPGIKTIDSVAKDVYSDRLSITSKDQDLGIENSEIGFLNSKGFGGNNATATVLSPIVVDRYLAKKYSQQELKGFRERQARTAALHDDYISSADGGKIQAIYQFGSNMVDEDQIEITSKTIKIPGHKHAISLEDNEGFESF